MSLLVTGTDTGIGKTMVAAAICAAARDAGVPVQALKPVESGTADNGGLPADAQLLARVTGVEVGRAYVYGLDEPLAPVVAAQRAGVTLDIARMDARVEALRARGPIVVEGVGGALVEVVPGVAVADLGARWDLDVLIVAGNRLGVLNHTLLTVEAVAARGARIAGVVLNTVHPGEPTVAERTNAAELARLLPASAPLLGAMPFVQEATAASLAQAGEELTARLLPFLR